MISVIAVLGLIMACIGVKTGDGLVREVSHIGSPSIIRNSKLSRHVRDVSVSSTQISQLVDIHNFLRRQEGSSNMEFMTWNDYLAGMATDWAKGCNFNHGQPTRDPKALPYDPVGQNLFAVSGVTLNVTRAVVEWYNEKADYNYDTLECTAGKMCGHYTQVVWSSSRQVGCDIAFCPVLASTTLRSAYYLVCNYGPAGNYQGVKTYKKGAQCSDCTSGIGWCTDGLCNGDCSSKGPSCVCGAKCFNCGVLKADSCTCQCPDGWFGSDCSVLCKDTSTNCNANPGWPPSWCSHPANGKYVRAGCPAMCGLCKKVDNIKADQCPPVGGLPGGNSASTAFRGDLISSLFVAGLVIFIAAR